MQAIILAAGESSRFYPYSLFGHKSLVTLLGKTIIERTIDSVIKSGIKKILIVEDINKSISKEIKGNYTDIDLEFISQKKAVGMGDALLSVQSKLEKEFYVVTANHFEFENFAVELKRAKKKETDIVVLTKEDEDLSEFGAIKRENGKIKVSEKSKNSENRERIVGIYFLNKYFIDILKNMKKGHYDFEDAISEYSNVYDIVIAKTNKKTLSLKYPWDLLESKDYLLSYIKNSISKTAQVSDKAVLIGENITVEEEAKIMEGAVIKG